ncbi:MAG TPA: ABC transporter permease [Gammaproteobacteria bacterium]|nr:ABC transporter permease [Gammaproteobacteria bacterium]
MKRRHAKGAAGAAQAGHTARPANLQRAPRLRRRRGLIPSLVQHLAAHGDALRGSLAQLLRTPWSTLLTATVIGVALALPAGFYAILENLQTLSGGWERQVAQISLFLNENVSTRAAESLITDIRALPEVATVDYISPAQALAEFKQMGGMDNVLAMLDENPLPAVLLVHPHEDQAQARPMKQLQQKLAALPQVESTVLDLDWLARLQALLALGQRAVLVLAAMLGVAVLIIVGNTIRLAVENRRQEIVVTKLIGATDGYIRRPFLYGGIWYGLAGSGIALILVNGLLWALAGPTQQLAALYHSHFSLSLLLPGTAAAVLLSGAGLGLLGAWLAVARHLRDIEPA